MMRLLLLISVVFCAVTVLGFNGVKNCGERKIKIEEAKDVDKRMVNGDVSRRHAWPWLVSLFKDGGPAGCIGTIIDSRWVLTAAHCFWKSREPGDFYVVTGEHDRSESSAALELYKVDKIIFHSMYDFYWAKSQFDIALMRLTYDIQFDKTAQPVCLPEPDMTFDSTSQECYAAGWGHTEGTSDSPNLLHEVEDSLVDNDTCDSWYKGDIFENMVCFGSGSKKPCSGDSGAPIMCKEGGRWYQVGVHSWGSRPCTTAQTPAVATRVSSFLDWMQDVIDNNSETDY